MRTADQIIVFAVKVFGTFGIVFSSTRSAIILEPHGWHLASGAIVGGIALLSIIWGWFK